VAKSQVSAGLAEVAPAKTAYELAINDGRALATTDLSEIGIKNSERCAMSMAAYDPSAGITAKTSLIQCTLKGNAKIANAVINMDRDQDGSWSCRVSNMPAGWKDAYLPSGCSDT